MWDFSTVQFKPDSSHRSISELRPVRGTTPNEEAEMKRSAPAAIVLFWTAENVTVLCPFCHRSHKHVYAAEHFRRREYFGSFLQDTRGRYEYVRPSPDRCVLDLAPCTLDQAEGTASYTVLFPFEDDPRTEGLDFEINPSHGAEMYCTVGLPVQRSKDTETEKDRRIRLGLKKIPIGNDPITNMDSGSSSSLTSIVAGAAAGDVPRMEDLLSRSPNPQFLLEARDPGEGGSVLSLAIRNGHSKAVDFFIDHGVDVNAADAKGRTPLMEAALWGQPRIVDKLLRAGARSDVRDNSGRVAAEFADESEANDEERHQRHLDYSESPYFAKQDRKFIRGLLGGADPREPNPKSLAVGNVDDAFFHNLAHTNTISFVTPRTGIHISSLSKTCAFLDRGNPFSVVGSLSGFKDLDDQEFFLPGDGFEQLNCQYWKRETVEVARAFGFEFPSHACDQGRPGSFFASHAEAMLMCFYVKRNYIFRDYREGDTVKDDFLQLFLLQPRNRGAHVIVSKTPCDSCTKLRECIRSKLDVKFDFVVVETREQGDEPN
ncbi:ankyrin repeat protein [Chaetomium tenue]|uniref:Ankyrin repeat protein n=1 Tax=Chaetomium tenue TaxID=1854479 RepID=A0ACB7NVK3_9PEZI|nr:ankyrin repeat protein [Chaetomium globosum]